MISIQFTAQTSAFEEDGIGEVLRILDRLRQRIEEGERNLVIRDRNAIAVGTATIQLDVGGKHG